MPYTVDFNTVSAVGLESSPVASALAGLRANEARYFKNKYDHVFTVEPADDAHDPPRFFSWRTDEQIQGYAREFFEIVDFHAVPLKDHAFQSLTLRAERQ